jgi:hypothetical protein
VGADLPETDAAGKSAYSLEQYSVADLVALLETAAGRSAEISGGELVRELKQLVNYDGFSYYEIPADPARYGKETPEELRRLVSNYLVLLSGGVETSPVQNEKSP